MADVCLESTRCAPLRAPALLCAAALSGCFGAAADAFVGVGSGRRHPPASPCSARAMAAAAARSWVLDRRWRGHTECAVQAPVLCVG